MLFNADELDAACVVSDEPECIACGLFKTCKNPKIKPHGKNKKRVMIIGEAPHDIEDIRNKPFTGKAGQYLRNVLEKIGLDMARDCVAVNAINCRPKNNQAPTDKELDHCRPLLEKALREYKPKVILILGSAALKTYFKNRWQHPTSGIMRWRGFTIPDKDNRWIVCSFDPEYIIKQRNDDVAHTIFRQDLESVKQAMASQVPAIPNLQSQIKIVTGEKDARRALRKFRKQLQPGFKYAFDWETNCIKPNGPDSKIFSIALASEHAAISVLFFDSLIPELRKLFSENYGAIAANMGFEQWWCIEKIGAQPARWAWDTTLAAHVIDNRQGICRLELQLFLNFGLPDYSTRVKKFLKSNKRTGYNVNEIDRAPVEEILMYGGMDAIGTFALAHKQMSEINHRGLHRAYTLFHEGTHAMTKMTATGICIDARRVDRTIKKINRRSEKVHAQIKKSKEGKCWQKLYGNKINYLSDDQLAAVLYDELGHECTHRTEGGKQRVNGEALKKIATKFSLRMLRLRMYDKLIGTYLHSLQQETVDGRLHAIFNLAAGKDDDKGGARSYRGSSSMPNAQNWPVRDPFQGKIIRSCIRASAGCRLIEMDYGQLEVRIGAPYHKDKNMVEYLSDDSKDMHGDSALDIFLLKPKELSKEIRTAVKSGFVFAQFYGSYYAQCAEMLWRAAKDLKTTNGMELLSHLERKDIRNYATFENHIARIEKKFWTERFPQYEKWRTDFYNAYTKIGRFRMHTGFECQGIMGRREVTNYPIQGAAFHCLLLAIIKMEKEITARKFNARLVAQIHDAILLDVPDRECSEIIKLGTRIMTTDVPEEFRWIGSVPLEIEFDITPIEGNWHEKSPGKFSSNGRLKKMENGKWKTI